MNVTLTESGFTLDGKSRLVPVEPTYDMAILSLDGGLDYRLGVKAAPPPPQQSPWQPIATAPKDGTEILMLRPSGKRIVVWWDANGWKSGDGVGHLALTPHAKWMHLPEATS